MHRIIIYEHTAPDTRNIRQFEFDENNTAERDAALQELAESTDLKKIFMNDMLLGDEQASAIAQIVVNNPHLEELDISTNHFGSKGIEEIAQAAGTYGSLATIRLRGNNLQGREGALAAAQFFDTCPHIQRFSISENPLGDEGINALDEALPIPLLLRELTAVNCGITENGIGGLCNLLERMPVANSLFVFQDNLLNNAKSTGAEALFTAAQQSGNKNLTYMTPAPEDMGDIKKLNSNRASALRQRVIDTHASDMEFTELAECYERRNAIGVADYVKERLAEFIQEIAAMPGLPQDGQPFDALFKTDKNGIAPVDNPKLWDDPAAVMAFIDQSGVALDAQTLQRKTERGTTLLQAAFEGYHARDALAELNQRDVHIQKEFLLQDSGEPTPFFQHLIDRGDGDKLFTPDNWRTASPDALKTCVHALPESQQAHVPMHRLLHSMRQTARENSLNESVTR